MPERVLITGANRGIGLELVRICAARGDHVEATCRRPDDAVDLQAISGDVTVSKLDITSSRDLDDCVTRLDGSPLDLLICNAAVPGRGTQYPRVDWDAWRRAFDVNVLGTMQVALALAPNVAASDTRRLVIMASKAGVVRSARAGMSYAYRSSKTALNAAARILAGDLEASRVTVALVNPGHVRTEIGGARAPMSPEESATAVISVVDQLTPAHSGRFWHYDGSEIAL
jgi:NAD(P)-dependent dehydrogenase (short-subunit alcohol dehydrogenase family)